MLFNLELSSFFFPRCWCICFTWGIFFYSLNTNSNTICAGAGECDVMYDVMGGCCSCLPILTFIFLFQCLSMSLAVLSKGDGRYLSLPIINFWFFGPMMIVYERVVFNAITQLQSEKDSYQTGYMRISSELRGILYYY